MQEADKRDHGVIEATDSTSGWQLFMICSLRVQTVKLRIGPIIIGMDDYMDEL